VKDKDHQSGEGHPGALGIRKFSANLRYAADRLKQMRTPEDVAIPPNTLAERERDLARLRFIREQSRAIEKTRVARLNEPPLEPHAMGLMLAKVRGIGIETADMLSMRCFAETCEIAEPSHDMPA
jgi:transposase